MPKRVQRRVEAARRPIGAIASVARLSWAWRLRWMAATRPVKWVCISELDWRVTMHWQKITDEATKAQCVHFRPIDIA